MPDVYFRNTKTDKKYKVVRFDKSAGTVVLVGPHGVEFSEPFDKERFIQMGYLLEQEIKGD